MSQAEVIPSVSGEKLALSEMSPQTLYDKCVTVARNLWWTLATAGSRQSVP